ncbi:MAG: acyltransferase [Tepidisphaeraceae bacterium]
MGGYPDGQEVVTAFQNSSSATGFLLPSLEASPANVAFEKAQSRSPQPSLPWDERRVTALDGVRLIACLSVIWVHSDFGPTLQHIGRMGTTCFATMAAMFVLRAARVDAQKSYLSYLAQRFRQLMVPALIWVTLAMIPVEYRNLTLGKTFYWPSIEDVLCGRSRFLWFLPFAFVMSALLFPLGRLLTQLSRNGAGTIANGFCVLGLFLAVLPDQNFESLGEHAYLPERAWECLPVICWTISLDIWLRAMPTICGKWWLAVLGAAMAVLGTASIFTVGFTVLGKNVSGFGLYLIAIGSMLSPAWRWLAPVGRLSFGIYLVHAFVIGTVRLIPGLHADGTLLRTFPYFLLIACLSLGMAVLVRSNRWTSWMLR